MQQGNVTCIRANPFNVCMHHTQHVESYWSRVKSKFKRMKGCHQVQLPSYLDEFMWRERFGTTASSSLDNIIADIATQYPV